MTETEQNSSVQETKTVLADASDFNAVHALNSGWTLWFDNPSRRTTSVNWTANLKKIVSMKTVEEFWGIYNNVAMASDLPSGSNYHMFREGVRPEWEDPANANGGRWGYQFQRSIGEKVNEHWLHTLLACIGETFESSEDVCGAVFSNRKNCFRVAVWTRNAGDRESCENIGRHLKAVLGVNHTLEYFPHGGDSKSGSNAVYTV
ncbi:eukaryotic translation initiation factor 4E [Coemansia spiralis]|uniref:Eukaryotic translation initiation factor 4E n=2 Tax=Coemansia TaxID=4863 RepID=A0A9W8KV76_9FUNG|nr:translation initiation factor eIF 4e-like domain-containing protein [Coemansia spiralis]KAJ1986242.1 eukaryotic translation initiation factor 4E [Coemansia umbellata]KAJ2618679.1 eukaryotic translation initiation factor 4E [Coemansia sp. RSA 1358]KAJ2668712.1 eukaryotic translation initiation factor 4E [Coemansia spiralis]